MKVAIVGGSISGCAAAVMLSRLGMDVTVFERSKQQLDHRGAGMVQPVALVKKLQALDLLDDDYACYSLSGRPVYIKAADSDSAQLLMDNEIECVSIHWAILYEQLYRRLPAGAMQFASEVTSCQQQGDQVVLTVNDQEQVFDWVLFADGYQSLGRQLLFPDIQLRYTHYMVWRGIIPSEAVPDAEQILGGIPIYLYEHGHLLVYPVPDPDRPGQFMVNWAMYEDLNVEQVRPELAGMSPKELATVPGAMSAHLRQALLSLARDVMPHFPKTIIENTAEPFIQPIFDGWVPAYAKGRVALVGDASILTRPHTGASAAKSLQDLLALMQSLQADGDVEAALSSWSQARQAEGNKLYRVGDIIGKIFVTDMPDWWSMTKAEAMETWQEAIAKEEWYLVKK